MSNNLRLEALLARLQSQPNVTPEQVANLRSTLQAAVKINDALTATVEAGRLNGLELDFPGNTYNRSGIYDSERGIVRLPPQSLGARDGSDFNASDLAATLSIQWMMIDFSTKDGVTPEVIRNLQSSINRSPALADELKMAANGPVLMGLAEPEAIGMPLRGLEVLPESAGEGASYAPHTQTIHLKLGSLQRQPAGKFNEDDVTFLFAHEVKHNLTERESNSARSELNRGLQAISEGPPPHDYTAPIATYIQARAHDEAVAIIVGYNALRSAVLERHGYVDMEKMLRANDRRMADFIRYDDTTDTYTPLPGLSFNPDLSLSETPDNIRAMEHYYFRKAGELTGLGYHHEADYTHVVAAGAITLAMAWERVYAEKNGVEPAAHFNMQELGVNERTLERVGIWLRQDVSQNIRQPYYDSSQNPPVKHHFDHTHETHEYVPVMARTLSSRRREDEDALEPERASPRHDRHEHTEDPLIGQIRTRVHAQHAQHGREPDDESERVTMSLYAKCKAVGITRADHVVFSQPNEEKGVRQNEYIFVVQGKMDDPGMVRAALPSQQAANTPIEESLQKVRQIEQRERQEVLAQQQAQQMDGPAQGEPDGPKRGR